MYGVLGAVWLLDDEAYRDKLVKEALKRGSGDERQRYERIQQRKAEILKLIDGISTVQAALNERDRLNIAPQKPNSSPAQDKKPANPLGLPRKDPIDRSRQEAADYAAKRKQYIEALQAYRAQNSAILSERSKLMQELLQLRAEYANLEDAEKWLLLSMAIRNQSSLLGYMQGSGEK